MGISIFPLGVESEAFLVLLTCSRQMGVGHLFSPLLSMERFAAFVFLAAAMFSASELDLVSSLGFTLSSPLPNTGTRVDLVGLAPPSLVILLLLLPLLLLLLSLVRASAVAS